MFLVLDYHWGSGTNCTYSVCERWADDFMSGIYGCECRWNASDNYEYSGSQPTRYIHASVDITGYDFLVGLAYGGDANSRTPVYGGIFYSGCRGWNATFGTFGSLQRSDIIKLTKTPIT